MKEWGLRYNGIQKATRQGKMKRAKDVQCEKCGKMADHRHHEDYSKPLDVVYLCRKCHVDLHVEKRGHFGRPRLYNFDRIPVGGYGILRDYAVVNATPIVFHQKKLKGGDFKCFAWGNDTVVFRLQ